MTNYGDVNYWNERYNDDDGSPFDWLFSFDDLEAVLNDLVPNKKEEILLIGCGNAPFSPDMYKKGGYKNLWNTDLSDVAIAQQAAKYPKQRWEVMDILDMKLPDLSVKCLIDKSLIDTLLCYEDSVNKTAKMMSEIYRILAPGSRYITFSLHSIEENRKHFEKSSFTWKTSFFRVQSSRWKDTDECYQRAVAHTMIVCDKPLFSAKTKEVTYYNNSIYPLEVKGVLEEVEYLRLKAEADQVCLRRDLATLSTDEILSCLETALITYDDALLEEIRTKSRAMNGTVPPPVVVSVSKTCAGAGDVNSGVKDTEIDTESTTTSEDGSPVPIDDDGVEVEVGGSGDFGLRKVSLFPVSKRVVELFDSPSEVASTAAVCDDTATVLSADNDDYIDEESIYVEKGGEGLKFPSQHIVCEEAA